MEIALLERSLRFAFSSYVSGLEGGLPPKNSWNSRGPSRRGRGDEGYGGGVGGGCLHGEVARLHGALVRLHGRVARLHGRVARLHGRVARLHGQPRRLHGRSVRLHGSL